MNYVLIAIATAVLFTLYALWVRRARRGFVAAYAFPAGLRKKFAEVRPGLSEVHRDQVFDAVGRSRYSWCFQYSAFCTTGLKAAGHGPTSRLE
jgi:hypothetical protein